ncbi:MAG: SDR family NAD(P)-dependent oxidoreductase [Planctomycetia bacterium]
MTKIALVTGASKGVGRGIAYGLADDGWDVVCNYYKDAPGADATADEIRRRGRSAWTVKADVGYADQAAAMFAWCDARLPGPVRMLVNNSGVQTWASFLELKEEDWDRTIRTNLKGSFLCTQQAARRMKETGGGSIVNIGSGANTTPFPNLVDYCASKGGLEQLTRVAAVELGPIGVRVNCVAPGAIEIERTREESPEYGDTWGGVTPLGRVGKPADVAAAVVFLATDAAAFITGQTIYVDGGLWTQGVWPYPRG